MSNLLSAEQLVFSYSGRCALEGVSISLSPGEIVAIVGPNGSGKSTLIRVLLGELKRTSGALNWLDRPIDRWPRRELAKKVAYLPQHPTSAPGQTVSDVLRLGRAPHLRAFGVETIEDERVVREVATLLELDELLKRPMDGLSGGQRQRVFLGRCLVQQPVALLLDEPNTYLDVRHQMSLGREIRGRSREQKIGVIMASHDLNLAAMVADRMLLLSAGRVLTEGSPSEVLRSAALGSAFGVTMRIIESEGESPVAMPRMNHE